MLFSVQDRMDLAHRMGLTDTQVKTWYQNRRLVSCQLNPNCLNCPHYRKPRDERGLLCPYGEHGGLILGGRGHKEGAWSLS